MAEGQAVIAIIDDEPDILDLVSLHLSRAGYRVKTFTEAETFNRFLAATTPAMVILDLMLPDADGLDVCRFLKASSRYSSIPVIMLTARTEELDRVLGLELGADDYVTKPFSPKELVARVKAVLRRTRPAAGGDEIFKVGDVALDVKRHEVSVKGRRVGVTTAEFRILELLCSKPGWVFSREQLLTHLWGSERNVIDRTVDVHVRHLRQKLGSAASIIRNVRGVGYKVDA